MKMEVKIIEPIGLCHSASSILDEIKKNIDKYSNIYILGDVLHNEYVINYLSEKGIKYAKKIESIPKDRYTLVILPAHGTSPKVFEKLKKYNFIDLTCPKIKRMHKFVTDNPNNDIIFLGKKGHSETLAFKDYENVTIINGIKDIDKLKPLEKPMLLCQTTFSEIEFNNVSKRLKELYNDIVIINTLCSIPLDRISNIQKAECDLLMVIGSKTSSNANEIKNSKPNSIIIGNPSDIKVDELKKYNTIAIASASSTPIEQVNIIIEHLNKVFDCTLIEPIKEFTEQEIYQMFLDTEKGYKEKKAISEELKKDIEEMIKKYKSAK